MPNRLFLSISKFAASVAIAATGLAASAAGSTVFWIEPRTNLVFDRQVTQAVGSRAGLIVLRAPWHNPDDNYTLPAVVGRFKADTKAPVLSYAWANRFSDRGRSEADLLRNLDIGSPLAETKGDGDSRVKLLDVTNSAMRDRVVEKFVKARQRLGVDGFAVDLSTRTPSLRPTELAKRCKQETDFCPRYAGGMDSLFADLRRGLGPDSYIAFNGLFNFTPGQLQDQTKLLASANAAAIEFFGMDPKEKTHSFSKDILPFLGVIPTLPPDRSVLVFGRGPWRYTDYAEDFFWQRYLYASFLLAARANDLFKYHATFQVPTPNGRSGGLDYYADWNFSLGKPIGAARVTNGVYWREFASGLVAVAPDDGKGGRLPLARSYVTPEGQQRRGEIRLSPGQGLVLLNDRSAELRRPDRQEITSGTIAAWKWDNVQLKRIDGVDMLSVPPAKLPGEHDVLLDFERSAEPYERLQIEARLVDSSATIWAIAEIDDPKREYAYAVVEVSGMGRSGGGMRLVDAPKFRTPPPKSGGELWPLVPLKAGLSPGKVIIDSAAFEGTGYALRRWSHLRLEGAIAVSRLELSKPTMRLAEKR